MEKETPQKISKNHRKPRKKKKLILNPMKRMTKKKRWKFHRANINPTFPSLPMLWERPSLTVFVFGSLFDASVLVVLRRLWQLRTFKRNQPSRKDAWKKIGELSNFIQNVSMFLFHEHPISSNTKRPEVQRRYASHCDVLTTEYIYPTWNSNVCCKDLDSSN